MYAQIICCLIRNCRNAIRRTTSSTAWYFLERIFICTRVIFLFRFQDNIPLLHSEWLEEEFDDAYQIQPPSRWARPSNEFLFCASVPDGVLVASPHSCRHYYRCQRHRGVKEICPEGKTFNEEKQECDTKSDVECVLCPIKGTAIFRDPSNCNYYYGCENGRRKHFSCPAGHRFDSWARKCRPRELVHCDSQNICQQQNGTASDFFVADPNDCQK